MLYYKDYQLGKDKEWVVFVHGAGGSSSIWYRQIRRFRKSFNVLLVDLRGHGRSKDLLESYVKDNYTFNDVTSDLLEVIRHLNIRKAHYIGISMGTIIIRTLGEMAPQHMKSMILCGAITRLNIRSRLLVFLGHSVKRFVPYMWLYRLFAWVIMPNPRDIMSRNLFIGEAKKLYKKEFLRWFRLTNEVNPLLKYFKEKEIAVPTLYIMGDGDYMFLPPVRKIVQEHEHAILQVIEDCGHVCNIEKPALFNKLAIRFIQYGYI
ncbi:alpha/beta fold hydrolase [Catalinimonas niigatensis]|uniref:alpha/beta fold hydrolase n=1 Tax=Catalinimonas niigatensis TaxID=1397264 RepID=UPI0026662018|nr:alpha/beta hydrolase [Catalinimonas niigatensis]WPP53288.1 alpha/beta hydrolase [Catalinimonas niigatensis]